VLKVVKLKLYHFFFACIFFIGVPSDLQSVNNPEHNFKNSSFFKMLFVLFLVEQKKPIETATVLFEKFFLYF